MPNRENEGIRPGSKAAAITVSNNDLGYITKAVYIGVTGDMTWMPAGQDTTVVYKNCQAGSKIVMAAKRITAESVAMSLVADYDDYPTKNINP